MSTRRIYVDLDDVLGETARRFLVLLELHFGRRIAFEEITTFDLGESFGFGREELEEYLRLVHRPEALAAIEPMAGAREVLTGWRERGYQVAVLTGRPPATRDDSQAWLTRHGFPFDALHQVDKYSRYYDGVHGSPDGALRLDEVPALGFCFAVEDFLDTAAFLADTAGLPVALLDRPWNRDLSAIAPDVRQRIVRCHGWEEIGRRFAAP